MIKVINTNGSNDIQTRSFCPVEALVEAGLIRSGQQHRVDTHFAQAFRMIAPMIIESEGYFCISGCGLSVAKSSLSQRQVESARARIEEVAFDRLSEVVAA